MGKQFFGTDGIRGRVGDDVITIPFMYKLGRAIGCIFASQAETVLIGRDTRISGSSLQVALQAGLSSVGMTSCSLGVLPTPALSFIAKQNGNALGVMITASHNPYCDNGVKIFSITGEKIPDECELEIEEHILSASFDDSNSAVGMVLDNANLVQNYIRHCSSALHDMPCLKSLKVVLDLANGATVSVAKSVFSNFDMEFILINESPNGVNINLNCGATDLKQLQAEVIACQADCGIAFDGDGDRLMMVDHLGNVVDGDQLLSILVQAEIKAGSVPGVAGTQMTNLGFEKLMQKNLVPFKRARVGDRYVLELCHREGWTLGGESSGHIINLKYATTGDGILSALQVLKVMVESRRSLESLAGDMVVYPQRLINVKVNEVIVMDNYPELLTEIDAMSARLGATGRILVRPSGTESCVRVMVEGESLDEVDQLANELKDLVENHLCPVVT